MWAASRTRAKDIGGGLAVTGNYPGKARTPDELRADLAQAYSLIPGRHRLNLHASYGEFPGPVWNATNRSRSIFRAGSTGRKQQGIGLDFNPTFFAHEKADDGFTLAHPDAGIRQFWIEHGIACRKIGAAMGSRAGYALRHQRLDSRRLQGHARQSSSDLASDWPNRSTRSSPKPIDPAAEPGCGRMQAVRHGIGKLRGRFARVLSGLRDHADRSCSAWTRVTSIPPK